MRIAYEQVGLVQGHPDQQFRAGRRVLFAPELCDLACPVEFPLNRLDRPARRSLILPESARPDALAALRGARGVIAWRFSC